MRVVRDGMVVWYPLVQSVKHPYEPSTTVTICLSSCTPTHNPPNVGSSLTYSTTANVHPSIHPSAHRYIPIVPHTRTPAHVRPTLAATTAATPHPHPVTDHGANGANPSDVPHGTPTQDQRYKRETSTPRCGLVHEFKETEITPRTNYTREQGILPPARPPSMSSYTHPNLTIPDTHTTTATVPPPYQLRRRWW